MPPKPPKWSEGPCFRPFPKPPPPPAEEDEAYLQALKRYDSDLKHAMDDIKTMGSGKGASSASGPLRPGRRWESDAHRRQQMLGPDPPPLLPSSLML